MERNEKKPIEFVAINNTKEKKPIEFVGLIKKSGVSYTVAQPRQYKHVDLLYACDDFDIMKAYDYRGIDVKIYVGYYNDGIRE